MKKWGLAPAGLRKPCENGIQRGACPHFFTTWERWRADAKQAHHGVLLADANAGMIIALPYGNRNGNRSRVGIPTVILSYCHPERSEGSRSQHTSTRDPSLRIRMTMTRIVPKAMSILASFEKRHDLIIKATRLCKTYGSGGVETQALRGVDIQVFRREFLAIIGPSGSGKRRCCT